MTGRKLDPYTLRWLAKEMLRRARDKRYVGVQHGPQSYHRGFAYGGASALEHLAQVARTLATITAKEARALETKAKKGKRK